MTAEIAILNSSAIAIAADSAVTIGRGKKIYNSAIKVFTLSKVAPVGIMIYGNAGLIDAPWETIIKTYRSQLKDRTFPTLEGYAEDFLSFLPRQISFFPAAHQDSWQESNIAGYFGAIRDEVVRAVERRFKDNKPVDKEVTATVISDTIYSHHTRLSKLVLISGITARWEASFKRKLQKLHEKLVPIVFQNLPVDPISSKRLLEIATWIHSREIMSGGHSGVVICGFGEDDVYPVVITHLIDGVFEGKLKYKKAENKSHRIRNGNDCSIIPFAQDDMVASFMEGMNPAINTFIYQWLSEVFSRLPELLPDIILAGGKTKKDKARQDFSNSAKDLLTEFFSQLTQHKRTEHIDPIINMVRVLPKDELAAMAESLVNLTAFKRRMTDELETVGGPIDVAVISKGDGLVWVKRKHYFDPQLNQHFFANYFRGLKHGQK